MKLLLLVLLTAHTFASTISVVPVYEPISLHSTDVDDILSGTGETLQATVMPRPMALTGAFPEIIIESMDTPHPIPTNNPNYKVKEANLLVLCKVSISAESTETGLKVSIDISDLTIPEEVDLTARQLLKLTLNAIQRNVEENIKAQTNPLNVKVTIEGTSENNQTLKDLDIEFSVDPAS